MEKKIIIDRKIKLALAGCGRISASHFKAIQQHQENLELVSVCDVEQDCLERTIHAQKVRGHFNFEEMLEKTNADIVILATPSGLHAKQACLAAKYKKHVITEKPMATKLEDGLRMVKTCEEEGVYLFVVKQNRNNKTIKSLKQALDSGRFGKIYMVCANVFWTRPQSYYEQAGWRGTKEYDGGAFMNQACHYVDLLDWLIGPVESIQSMMGTLARDIEVEDTGVLNLKWRSGALGSMSVTMLTYRQNLEASITIIGERGTVKLAGKTLNEIHHWEFEDGFEAEMDASIAFHSLSGHYDYYQNVIQVFRGEEKPLTDGRDGLRSLELLISAYKAREEGKTIQLTAVAT